MSMSMARRTNEYRFPKQDQEASFNTIICNKLQPSYPAHSLGLLGLLDNAQWPREAAQN